jgi:hypothetical protein
MGEMVSCWIQDFDALRAFRYLSERYDQRERQSPPNLFFFRSDRPHGHLADVYPGSRPRPETVTTVSFRLTRCLSAQNDHQLG